MRKEGLSKIEEKYEKKQKNKKKTKKQKNKKAEANKRDVKGGNKSAIKRSIA